MQKKMLLFVFVLCIVTVFVLRLKPQAQTEKQVTNESTVETSSFAREFEYVSVTEAPMGEEKFLEEVAVIETIEELVEAEKEINVDSDAESDDTRQEITDNTVTETFKETIEETIRETVAETIVETEGTENNGYSKDENELEEGSGL